MGLSGCLNEEFDSADAYCEQGMTLIKIEDMSNLFTKSRRVMGSSSSFSDLYAETTKFFMTLQGSKNQLSTFESRANVPLLMILNKSMRE